MTTLGMRARIVRLLPDTCIIERKTNVSDDGGGTTSTWATHATVPCRIEPIGAGGETGMAGNRISDETSHIAYLPEQTDITEADRVVIDSARYEVTAVRTWGAAEVYRSVEIKEAA